jgi:hypothetical protein
MVRGHTVAPYQGEFQSFIFPQFVLLFFEFFWPSEFMFGMANRLNELVSVLVLTNMSGGSQNIFQRVYLAINFIDSPSVFFCI